MSEEKYHYYDLRHSGYSEKYRSGKICQDCDKEAGTAWTDYWCPECDIKRKKRIDNSLSECMESLNKL